MMRKSSTQTALPAGKPPVPRQIGMDLARIGLHLVIIFLFILLAGCAGAAPEQDQPAAEAEKETIVKTVIVEAEGETVVETVIVEEPAAEEPMEEEEGEPPAAVTPTAAPSATQAVQPTAEPTQPAPTQPQPTPTPLVEERLIEVEWPERLYLGDSDVVRMALIPSEEGYTMTTEFPDHQTVTQDVPVVRPEGYELSAVGRLDGVGFTISPSKEKAFNLPLDQGVTWHWSLTPIQPGQQRLTISLLLRWEPLPGASGVVREAVAYSKGLNVQVDSFFGLTRGQTLNTALIGLALGGSVVILAVFYGMPFGARRVTKKGLVSGFSKPSQIREPNRALEIESPAGLRLNPEEEALLRGLFQRYQRLLIQQEFLSGYSGARTFLLTPIRADGRADAPTIAKLGWRNDIEKEYTNYEAFVKRTLPPVTARIQAPPVVLKESKNAALQYTFIGEPGTQPLSLRQVLLDNPDPQLLRRLFKTFGPTWWMQRAPWTFRVAQEYDRLLPPHWMLEPDHGKGDVLDGQTTPSAGNLHIGDMVTLRNFIPKHSSGQRDYLTLQGKATSGQPALRLRWLAETFPRQAVGRVSAARMDLLRAYVTGFDPMELPDPLEKLEKVLNETIRGTQSIIHGDLNLENVLIGPAGMVWLIDFATTREGHPLMDFAHLEAEIIAHVIAKQITDAKTFLEIFEEARSAASEQSSAESLPALLTAVHEIAFKCLGNPSQPREYWLALYMSCLGALKYRNLDTHQKYLLYVTAAYIAKEL